MAYIEILAPDLLDAIRHAGRDSDETAIRIARRLKLADRVATDDVGFEAAVLSLFGMHDGGQSTPALAGVTAAFDFDLDGPPTDLLRADPVYLRADPNHLILFDADFIGVDEDEADALLGLLNQSFPNDGIVFKRGRSASRWYVSMPNIVATTTQSPRAMRGQAIEPHLEDLRRAGALNRLMTEIQMLLHEAPVNAARESAGKPPINSVWFWGSGAPPARSSSPLGAVVGEDDLVAACARFCGVAHADSAATFDAGGSVAVIYEMDARAPGLEHFERHLLGPACAALHGGRFDTLRIATRETAFVLTRRARWQFWRRLRSLKSVLQDVAGETRASGIAT